MSIQQGGGIGSNSADTCVRRNKANKVMVWWYGMGRCVKITAGKRDVTSVLMPRRERRTGVSREWPKVSICQAMLGLIPRLACR